jgi:hypothetical protein
MEGVLEGVHAGLDLSQYAKIATASRKVKT